jgi:hypothetical protein
VPSHPVVLDSEVARITDDSIRQRAVTEHAGSGGGEREQQYPAPDLLERPIATLKLRVVLVLQFGSAFLLRHRSTGRAPASFHHALEGAKVIAHVLRGIEQ